MALRLNEKSILSAEICNRQKNHVKVVIRFADGTITRASLRGNPDRDLAGRTLSMQNPSPDLECEVPDNLATVQVGVTGDITAARKVKVPLVPMSESAEIGAAKEDIPSTWKNMVYLEWYSRTNGRVVLEAGDMRLSITEPAWKMSEAEARQAAEAASMALSVFLDELCEIDREREREEDASGEHGVILDEFEWEKVLRHSDDLAKRYSELIEKFGLEDKETIARYMNWDIQSTEGESGWRDEVEIESVEGEVIEMESGETRRHPLQGQARQLLDSVDFPSEDSESPMAELWCAVATVSAKLAGALSSYEGDRAPDAGFTIAQLKRCLVHIDSAVGEAQQASPGHVQPLLRMRQDVIDLQNELRSL